MRKKFHIVKLHLEGRIDHPIRNVSPDMDVADEFHRKIHNFLSILILQI
ncbi:hypothetical protein HMPREF0577_1549 [Mobiluncus mulieris ATCC 35243]|nr:hypothetical protein HMPREF0577_1549 [Mobiluncus mulieris ATCC 35243]